MGSLKALLESGECIAAPGVGDALGALLVAEAGFPCVYMSGFQVSATLGHPDVGLLSQTEMVAAAARICAAVNIPVIADADDGYGGPINVSRTVQEFERAGVSAIHIEDQAVHRCGSAEGVTLVPVEEMCAKLDAALAFRKSGDFLVIARTDAANTPLGVAETIRRGQAYRKRGADAVMVHGLTRIDDMMRCRAAIEGPLVITIGSRVDVRLQRLKEIGYQIVLYPLTTLRLAAKAVQTGLTELRSKGFLDHTGPSLMPAKELHEFLGIPRYRDLEKRFSS